jgi:nucleoid-associated protein YgaU
MLRITRLHLIIAGIGVVCLLFGLLDLWGNKREEQGRVALEHAQAVQQAQRRKVATLNSAESVAMSQLRKSVVTSLATIGEAYTPLRRQFGDIPPISKPLRAAKASLAQGEYETAQASARESWQALKAFRKKLGLVAESYQVARGDTLWRIAAMHSPARDGAGWVTIWKANRAMVGNFNRIEIGMTLKIPQRRTDYIMPFWRPASLR